MYVRLTLRSTDGDFGRMRHTHSCSTCCQLFSQRSDGSLGQVHELSRLFREPVGIMFWVVLLTVLMGMQGTPVCSFLQLSSRDSLRHPR